MSAPAREESLNKIRHDKRCRVILISFKAGGVGERLPLNRARVLPFSRSSKGLNLTACNNVILLDLWWNPALEVSVQGCQRRCVANVKCCRTKRLIGRTGENFEARTEVAVLELNQFRRLGQSKDVYIYKLTVVDSVEDRILTVSWLGLMARTAR